MQVGNADRATITAASRGGGPAALTQAPMLLDFEDQEIAPVEIRTTFLIAGMAGRYCKGVRMPRVIYRKQMLNSDPPRRQRTGDIAFIWQFHRLAAIKTPSFLLKI